VLWLAVLTWAAVLIVQRTALSPTAARARDALLLFKSRPAHRVLGTTFSLFLQRCFLIVMLVAWRSPSCASPWERARAPARASLILVLQMTNNVTFVEDASASAHRADARAAPIRRESKGSCAEDSREAAKVMHLFCCVERMEVVAGLCVLHA